MPLHISGFWEAALPCSYILHYHLLRCYHHATQACQERLLNVKIGYLNPEEMLIFNAPMQLSYLHCQ